MRILFPAHRSAVLLGTLLAGMASASFSDEVGGHWLMLAGYVLLGIGATYSLGASRRWCVVVAVFGVAMITSEATLMSGASSSIGLQVVARVSSMSVVGLLIFAVIDYSLFSNAVNQRDRILAGICGYLLIAFLYSHLYMLIEAVDQQSFRDASGAMSRVDYLYFSLSSLSTLGYGDIVPISGPARIASAFESICGVLYLAILISTLVADRRRGDPGAGGSVGFGDPDARVGFGYVMNRMGPHILLDPRAVALIDALYESLADGTGRAGSPRRP